MEEGRDLHRGQSCFSSDSGVALVKGRKWLCLDIAMGLSQGPGPSQVEVSSQEEKPDQDASLCCLKTGPDPRAYLISL